MTATAHNPFNDACSRAHSKPALSPSGRRCIPERRARPVAPLDRLAARLQCVTLPYPASAWKPLRFWSMAYRGDFVENAALVLGVAGFAVVAAGKSLGVL